MRLEIPDGVTVLDGWADYRDRHLGPALKAFTSMQFGHSDTKVTLLPGGQSAYATSRDTINARMSERETHTEGLETLLLIRTADGWQIRHLHTSRRPRRPAQ